MIPWQHPAIRAFVVSRGALWLVGYLGLALIPIAAGDTWRASPDNLWLDAWTRWDGGWYGQIARDGYQAVPNAQGQRDVAFFPLYPWIVGLISRTGLSVWSSGIALSHAAFALALYWLHGLASRLKDPTTADRAVLLVAVYPCSFFLGAVYTEALFVATTVGAFYYAEQRRWPIAGALALAAGATRSVGVLATVGLLIIFWQQRPRRWRDAPLAFGAVAGLGVYLTFLALRFDDPLLFVRSQDAAGWAGSMGLAEARATWAALLAPDAFAAGRYPVMQLLNLLAVPACALGGVYVWRTLGPAYGAWTLLVTGVSAMAWVSMLRHASTLFPVFIVVAAAGDEATQRRIVLVSAALMALLFVAFSHGYWVA
ncbi:MAG: mannosyltransferase family protein [Myxococcota bacterium]